MGRPARYSTEVPVRCPALIEMLVDKVERHSDPDGLVGRSATTQAMPRRAVFHRGAGGHSRHRWSPSGHQAKNDKTASRRFRYKSLSF